MSHEISKLDISDRQLQASAAQSKAGNWTDIGEAEITHTVFGRAKVRIIRKHDTARRALLLTATAAMVLAALVWQVWLTFQQAEPQRSADPASAISATEMEHVQSPTGINQEAISQHSVPQPAVGLNGAGQMPAKTIVARPLSASKPQTAPLAANDNAFDPHAGMQRPAMSSSPNQPVAPAVAIPAAQPVQLVKQGAAIPSPTSVDHAAAPGSAQP